MGLRHSIEVIWRQGKNQKGTEKEQLERKEESDTIGSACKPGGKEKKKEFSRHRESLIETHVANKLNKIKIDI